MSEQEIFARLRADEKTGRGDVSVIENAQIYCLRAVLPRGGGEFQRLQLHRVRAALEKYEWRYNHRHKSLLPLVKKLYGQTYLN